MAGNSRHPGRRAATAPACASCLAHRAALRAIEYAARVRDGVVGYVYEIACAMLAKHVAPIIAVRPKLRVFEREVDAPKNSEDEEVSVADQRRDEDDAVHEQIRSQFAPERDDFLRLPAAPLFG